MSSAALRSRLLRGEILLLDGGLGTELSRRGVRTPLPLWSAEAVLTAPDVVRQVHEEYILAGADLITANTFRATPRAMAKAGRAGEAERVLDRAVALAREACRRVAPRREVIVAGAVAPLEDCYRPDLAPPAEVAEREHVELSAMLARAGVDAILIETMNTLGEACAAVHGAKPTGLAVLVSFICRNERELLSGDSLSEAVRAVEAWNPDAVLVNCTPPDIAGGCLDTMASATRLPRGAYANAGAPDLESGAWRSDPAWTAERFARAATEWVRRGAQIVGGCCGTTPDHIRAIRAAIPPVLVE
ncbi:MAG TPA: homocysteine S-methyltransferase family protein [Candidatus Eisenbacteria bacterium]|jgi:S-methylmethionine-dependent homocysteine/selenocysteine methylase